LTLINGRRLAQDTQYGAVDVSLVPLDAVDRIEVITDGASAVYGSDAVAGVVNLILKKDFNGAQSTASTARATQSGGFDRKFSQLLGTTWGGGGGLLVYEHDKLDAVFANQRDFTSTAYAPFTLLPPSSRDSVFATVHQDLSGASSLHFDALYTSRDSENVTSYPDTYRSPADVEQFAGNLGFDVRLPGEWRGSLAGSWAEQRTDLSTFGPGGYSSFEKLRGRNKSVEVDADGPLVSFGERTVRVALGAGYRSESFLDSTPDAVLPTVDADRTVRYAFAEVAAPLVAPGAHAGIERLELTASGRYEDYSAIGNKAVPKLGLVYAPTGELAFRAAWGKSFAAPTLYSLYRPTVAGIFNFPDPGSTTGPTTRSLAVNGGNPALQPEQAITWTAGFDFHPEANPRLKWSTTYFEIRYSDRIDSIPTVFTALQDATLSSLVTRLPTAEFVSQTVADARGGFINASGQPYDPATILAFVDGRDVNLSRQKARGVDMLARYGMDARLVATEFFFNGSYLKLEQRFTPDSAESTLSGTSFYPPKFRARAGVEWTLGEWSLVTAINHTGSATNTFQLDRPHVDSWTTLDAQIMFRSGVAEGWLEGIKASLALQNAFDRDPPYVLFDTNRQGIHYDPVNASPMGRYVTLTLSKTWQ
jgi:outer membrane receptor protein involved in Fe transport